MPTDVDRLNDFFQKYGAIYKIAGRFEQELEKATAPNFSIFSYLSYDEMVISRIIGDLLDPHGKHGQGALFLDLFINEINEVNKKFDNKKLSYDLEVLNKTIITLEAPTSHIKNSQRRIDILLENDSWVMAIENKPWAQEQEVQLKDYQEEIEKRCQLSGRAKRTECLIYLSGDYSSSKSHDKNKPPLLMGYNRGNIKGREHIFLTDWLTQVRNCCQVDKVRHFLTDFALWVENNFNNRTPEDKERETDNESDKN